MRYYYTGRKKIVIPVSVNQFKENPIAWIKKYLDSCLSVNSTNKQECDDLRKIYENEQDIWNKTRANKNDIINNKVLVNHSFRQVEFKKGFMVGKPIEYALANTIDTDDLTQLNTYFRDCNKPSLDIDKYEDVYICGIKYQFIMPRKDIFDIKHEAPFVLCNIENGNAFTVYSNDITNTRLFDVIISKSSNLDNYSTQENYDIYFINKDNKCYATTMARNNGYKIINQPQVQSYKFLPLIEYTLNKGRMGIVEVVVSIQRMLNLIHSNQIDDIVEFVNGYIIFKNQNIDKKFYENFEKLKKQRVLAIKSTNPQMQADVSLLKQSLQHEDINSFYELLKTEMYDIVGVPLSTSNTTSGGDTGVARQMGNGWESAQTQASVDTTYMIQFENELLKKVIAIAKDFPDSPIEDIYASDIEIKFSINMSNNLLVKAQSLKYLYDMNMPYEEALTMTGITGDTHGVGAKWRENDTQKIAEESQAELQKANQSQNQDNDDNSINNAN